MCFINQKESPQDNYYKCICVHAHLQGFPGGSVVKNSPAMRRCSFDPWVGKIPWRREWQPTPFLPGKSHECSSLADYSPWNQKESDSTERVHFHFQTQIECKTFQKIIASKICKRHFGFLTGWFSSILCFICCLRSMLILMELCASIPDSVLGYVIKWRRSISAPKIHVAWWSR